MNDQELDSLQVIRDFLNIVQHFCTLIEQQERYPTGKLLRQIHLSLNKLYNQFVVLPKPHFTLSTTQQTTEQEMTKEVIWEKVTRSLQQKLGDEAKYTWVVGSGIEEIEFFYFDLADDLATIYCDLKLPFEEWQEMTDDDSRFRLYYGWWFWFWSHKGILILRVITQLQRYFTGCLHRPMYEGWQYLGGEWR